MSHTRLWIAATIIALVIAFGFMLSVPHTRDLPGVLPASATATSAPIVALSDVYKKSMHTISGSVMAADACASASADAILVGEATSTQRILVRVTLSDEPGVCLELPTRETFQATIAAPARLPLAVTVNGASATTTAP